MIKINEVNYLHKLPLKLSKKEQAIIQNAPAPRILPPAKKDPTKLNVGRDKGSGVEWVGWTS